MVRKARFEDVDDIVSVSYSAIYNIAKNDYNKDILKEWFDNIASAVNKPFKGGEAWVYESDGGILGFIALIPYCYEIKALYTHSQHGRRGIGTQLLKALEGRALELKLSYVITYASLTGQAFYKKNGYEFLADKLLPLSNGKEMKSVLMKKELRNADSV